MAKQVTSASSTLCAPIKISTTVPFIEQILDATDSKVPVQRPSTSKKIQVDVCSELSDYRAALEYFEKNGKIRMTYDEDAQPIIFTLDGDQNLCALRHVSGAAEGWTCVNISPTKAKVSTYDIMESGSNTFVAAVCFGGGAGAESFTLHYTMVKHPAVGEAISPPKWTEIKDNTKSPIGPIRMAAVTCEPTPRRLADKSLQFQIVVGTASSSDKTGTFYKVVADEAEQEPWQVLTFPAAASQLLQTEPLVVGHIGEPTRENGMVSVFHGYPPGEFSRCAGHVYAPDGGLVRDFEIKAGSLGGVHGVYSHLNPWGFTDILFAGEKGIGFCDFDQPDVLSQIILPNTSFRQVVCSEKTDPDRPREQSRLAVFAVSNDEELYYLDGIRSFADRALHFEYSGLPIRRGVTHMSARFNAPKRSSELLFAENNDNALHYLRRSPSGRAWVEDRITRKAVKMVKYDAFMTTLALTDGAGNPVPASYSISVTSDPFHVVANGKAYSFSQDPTMLTTDETGTITIVVPSDGKFGCAPLTVTMDAFVFKVNLAQRVDKLIGKLGDQKTLESATASNGKKIFDGVPKEKLHDAASVFEQYPKITAQVKSPDAHVAKDIELSKTENEDANWFSKAVAKTEEILGDCIEAVKIAVKATVKLAIRILGPVVKLVFKIGKAIFSVVLKGLDMLLTSIGNFLQNVFGLDFLNRLLNYFKAMFDPKVIAQTQKVLKDTITGGFKVADRFLTVNRASVVDIFDDAEDLLKQYIDDPREPPREDSQLPSFGWILNNPVVRLLSKINPISWVMEAVSEELPDLKIPSFKHLLTGIQKVVATGAEDQLKIVMQLFDTIVSEMSGVTSPKTFMMALLNALKSVLWTLFDTVKNGVLMLYDAITVFVRELEPILNGVWKLGGLTDMWEDLTGQDFTLLGFATYPIAMVLTIASTSIQGRLPFAEMESLDFDAIEIKQLYTSKRSKREKAAMLNDQNTAKQAASKANLSSIQRQEHMLPNNFSSMQASAFPNGPIHSQHAPTMAKAAPNQSISMQAGAFSAISFAAQQAPMDSTSASATSPPLWRSNIHALAVICENIARFGVLLSMQLDNMAHADHKLAQQKGYTPQDQKIAYNPDGTIEYGSPLQLRCIPVAIHGCMLLLGTAVKDEERSACDSAVTGCAIFELLASVGSLLFESAGPVTSAGELAAECGTIVRCCAEDTLLGPAIPFMVSAGSGIVCFVSMKLKRYEIAFFATYPDVLGNVTGIVWTVVQVLIANKK